MSCQFDALYVFDDEEEVQRLCGNDSRPNDIISNSQSLRLKFKTDSIITDEGFLIEYASIPGTDLDIGDISDDGSSETVTDLPVYSDFCTTLENGSYVCDFMGYRLQFLAAMMQAENNSGPSHDHELFIHS